MDLQTRREVAHEQGRKIFGLIIGMALYVAAFGYLLANDSAANMGTVLAAIIGPPIAGAILGDMTAAWVVKKRLG